MCMHGLNRIKVKLKFGALMMGIMLLAIWLSAVLPCTKILKINNTKKNLLSVADTLP